MNAPAGNVDSDGQAQDMGPVGVMGLGSIGAPMACRLTGAGFQVLGCDQTPERTAAAVTRIHGARQATPGQIGEACRVVILSLPDSPAVESVLFGSNGSGLAAALTAGSVVVDMGSSDPNRTRDLGARLALQGVRMVDAPVSGGVAKAVDGTLSVMAGGDDKDIDLVLPLLRAIGRTITRTGPLGSAHAMKALNNYVSATGLLAACEALRVGQAFGLEPATIVAVLNASSGRNNSTENKLSQFVLNRAFNSGFSIGLMQKDLSIAMRLAEELSVTTAIGPSVLNAWRDAAECMGANADHTAIYRFVAGERNASGKT